ncbi:MAG: nickel-dependent lactate racemase [Eubacteriales bacterium]|nr:nickel-dependent lactate racemase [Eubacteriales bacterium]
MPQKLILNYGDGTVPLTLQGAASVTLLQENPSTPIENLPEAFRAAVEENAIDSKPLAQLLSPTDDVTIVISDVTRMWMHQDQITELLIRYLHDNVGMAFERIVVLVALGTHRPQTEEEMRRTASDYAVSHVRCVNHNGDGLVLVGTTSRGTPVKVNPLAIDRKLILIGGTVHHLLAGYGGGRKSILPGISGEETIQANHRLALHPTMPCSNPSVGIGKLDRNPVHEDMMEAAAMVKPLFSINLVVNSAGRHVGLLCGDYRNAWLESCKLVNRLFGVRIDQQYDVVIVSGGGYPKDINLYQGSKTLINAVEAVKPGGEILYISECREGGGPESFFGWMKPLNEGRLDEALREDFTIAGYIFYVIHEFCTKYDIRMLTALNPDNARAIGLHPVSSPEKLLEGISFQGKSVAVMPYGGSIVPLFSR